MYAQSMCKVVILSAVSGIGRSLVAKNNKDIFLHKSIKHRNNIFIYSNSVCSVVNQIDKAEKLSQQKDISNDKNK